MVTVIVTLYARQANLLPMAVLCMIQLRADKPARHVNLVGTGLIHTQSRSCRASCASLKMERQDRKCSMQCRVVDQHLELFVRGVQKECKRALVLLQDMRH
jgi:hypothetical protein